MAAVSEIENPPGVASSVDCCAWNVATETTVGPDEADAPTVTWAIAVSHQALSPLGIVTPVLVTYSLEIQKPDGLFGSATALELAPHRCAPVEPAACWK